MKIKKALIAAAGFGTRFLPITKTIQKEMLPVLSRPIIDYLVEDLVQSGVEEIIFVISEHNKQLLHYYRENQRLFEYLKKHGKEELYSQVSQVHQKAKFYFIKQLDSEIYGTATPLKIAQSYLENEEAFFVFMGDDFIFDPQEKSEAKKMKELFEKSGAAGLVTCIQKPDEELNCYGVAKVKQQNGFSYLEQMVEKPAAGQAPSNLVNLSKYILTPAIFEIIKNQQPNQGNGELYITDSVAQLAATAPVVIFESKGQYLDCGYVLGWLEANLTVALNHPQYAQPTRALLNRL